MKKKNLLNRILFIGFISNLILIIFLIAQFVIIFTNVDLYIRLFHNYYSDIALIMAIFLIPTAFLFIYNIIFIYKHDRYSKSLVLIYLFGFIYSPYYYYKVKYKGKNLINTFNKEPVIGNKISLEYYENEQDYIKDIQGLNNKFGG